MTETRSIISIQNVTKRFGSAVTAVDNVSLDIQEGEFFALLGPSGCGCLLYTSDAADESSRGGGGGGGVGG